MQLIDGKKIADEILETLKSEIELMHAKPCLAIVLVGNNESSKIYVRNKIKAAEKVGIETKLLEFDVNVVPSSDYVRDYEEVYLGKIQAKKKNTITKSESDNKDIYYVDGDY